MIKRKNGFTLAEVMITLFIIGIVAVLTIPNFVQNYRKSQTITKVRKAYTVINSAYRMAVAMNGNSAFWFESGASAGYTTSWDFFTKYVRPYYKIERICTGEGTYDTNGYKKCGYDSTKSTRSGGWVNDDIWNNYRVVFQTQDGIMYFIYPFGTTCIKAEDYTPENPVYTSCTAAMNGAYNISIDINGSKGPNTWGKDLFLFELDQQKQSIVPACSNSKTPEKIDENCSKSSYEGGFCCAAKLFKDSWHMKGDYPW